MVIMPRLEIKGPLIRRRRERTDVDRAVYRRERYADLRAGIAIDSIVEQSREVALAHLARRVARRDPAHRRSLTPCLRK
jgi:predicted transcriptional regulator